jgi:hypothetical protein
MGSSRRQWQKEPNQRIEPMKHMATIEILGWKKDFAGFTAWDDHAKSELRRRLRRGLKASQAEIKRVTRQIDAREVVSLQNVHDEAVDGITQTLETTGADIRVSIEGSNSQQLFRRIPKR